MESLHSVITGLSLGQTFLLFLWVLSLLIHKFADEASSLLWQWFFEYLFDDAPGASNLSSLEDDFTSSWSDGGEDVEDDVEDVEDAV